MIYFMGDAKDYKKDFEREMYRILEEKGAEELLAEIKRRLAAKNRETRI